MALKGLDRLVEARIQGAIARGDLDRLAGQGKPLKEYDLGWLSPEERAEVLVARSAGGVPEEVRLLREIAELREELAREEDGPARQRLAKELQEKSLRLSVMFEASGRYVLVNPALDGVVRAGGGRDPEPAAGERAPDGDARPPRGRAR